SVFDVRRDCLDLGAAPEILDRRLHCLGGDPFVSSRLGHPPAGLDFVGGDALDAIAGEAQLGAAQEAVIPLVPDGPCADAVLWPLHAGAASATQGVGGTPRCTGMLGLVESRQREEFSRAVRRTIPPPSEPATVPA